VAVDPQLGRIVLSREADKVRVSYHYGFSGDVGTHESPRTLSQPRQAQLYRVGVSEEYPDLRTALEQWRKDAPRDAVVEIADNRVYSEAFPDIPLAAGVTLQIRAANRRRPVLRMLDYNVSRGERLRVLMHAGARFTLDGIMLTGRPLRIDGVGKHPVDVRVAIRRSTLVPGWDLRHDCEPAAPDEASLELANVHGHVTIDRSILGTIVAMNRTTAAEPIAIQVRDSIVDATSPELEAIMGPNAGYAWAALTIVRSTVIGRVLAHGMELGENSIFTSLLRIVRRQRGCVRFCYVLPESRTPRGYHSQPELAVAHADDAHADEERRRVAPRFTSTRFGDPGYCQLASGCPVEITTGADDSSEMGAFHDLFAPQRAANLRARLDQSTPAGMQTGIIYVD
jgi:hypothetical protein